MGIETVYKPVATKPSDEPPPGQIPVDADRRTLADLVRAAGKFYCVEDVVWCDTPLDSWYHSGGLEFRRYTGQEDRMFAGVVPEALPSKIADKPQKKERRQDGGKRADSNKHLIKPVI